MTTRERPIKRSHRQGTRHPATVKIWQMESIETTCGPIEEPVPKTLHEGLLMGLLETGAVRAYYRGTTHTLRRGALILCQPGETVAFEPIGGTLPVRMCVLCPRSVLEEVVDEIPAPRTATLFFSQFISPDSHLVALLRRFQGTLETPTPHLERSSLVRGMLTRIVRDHASPRFTWRDVKPERVLVKRVREYLDEHAATNMTLNDLARVANVSTFHLNRVFRSEVGLPPHAYQTQVRVMRSKVLLAQGMAIGQVALELGFFDQSHFTNHFTRLLGYTPGTYRENILGKR